MEKEILNHLEEPALLEKLYRENKNTFKTSFNSVYATISQHPIARAWHERLNYESDDISWGTRKDWAFMLGIMFLAGLAAKLPDLAGITRDYYYSRNISFIVFPFLTLFYWRLLRPGAARMIKVAAIYIAAAVYINLLPDNNPSDTLNLACMHLPLFLWTLAGYAYTGPQWKLLPQRTAYLRFNGDLVVMTALILAAGGLLTGVTIGLFSLIDIKIETFFSRYLFVWGLPAAPLAGAFLVKTNPQLVNKVSPVIARVFTPLVLVTLTAYLAAVIFTGKNPYNDREFLVIFNALLIGVLAIIFFSITGISKQGASRWSLLMLLMLAVVTVAVNGVALSAIVYRIGELGLTPNRLAVLGANLLMIVNLCFITYRLFRAVNDNRMADSVSDCISLFMPAYSLWALAVTLIFPLIFNFR